MWGVARSTRGVWAGLVFLAGFLVLVRLWPTRKRAPTSDVDTRGTASVALTPPIRTISILPFTIITTVKSAFLPGVMVVCPEGGSLTVTPSSSWDLCCSLIGLHRHTMVPVRVSSTLACRQVQWVPGRVLSSWQKKNWISGGIRNGIRTGMRTTVVGSRRVVVLMAMTPTISTPRTTIITRISSSHLGPPHRLDGVRIFCLGLTNPNLSLSLSFFNVWGVEVSSWDICCCFVDPLGSGKAGFLVGSGLGYPRV